MNYAEKMFARQMLLWQRICAALPAETEEEEKLFAKERLSFQEELRSAQKTRRMDSVRESDALQSDEALYDSAWESDIPQEEKLLYDTVRHAVYAAMEEMRRGAGEGGFLAAEKTREAARRGTDKRVRGGTERAVDAWEADALMRALSKESMQRSANVPSRRAANAEHGAHTAAFGESAAGEDSLRFLPAYEETAHLYGVTSAAEWEMRAQGVTAQEVSRRFERDSRRYDAAFIRYE